MLKQMTPDYLLKLLSGSLLACSMVIAYVNYLVAEKILKRLKYDIKDPTPFRLLNMDAKLGLVVVIVMFTGSLLYKYKIPAGEYMYNSAYFLLIFMLTVQGLSVIAFLLLERLKMPKAGVAAIMIIGFSVLTSFAVYLGIADLIFDLRKINKNSLFYKRGK